MKKFMFAIGFLFLAATASGQSKNPKTYVAVAVETYGETYSKECMHTTIVVDTVYNHTVVVVYPDYVDTNKIVSVKGNIYECLDGVFFTIFENKIVRTQKGVNTIYYF